MTMTAYEITKLRNHYDVAYSNVLAGTEDVSDYGDNWLPEEWRESYGETTLEVMTREQFIEGCIEVFGRDQLNTWIEQAGCCAD
jgi:hypothetical protein